MILNDRKIKILEAIINDYIQTAEPIGSRTIAKRYGLGISSATIRNEMSDLEEMGFILQPHASAGRVPSDKGYRLYVDSMMRQRTLTDEETLFLQQIIINNINQIDYMIQETAKAIAYLTRYTTIISQPYRKLTIIKHTQLIPLDEKSLLLVLVTDAKTVKNQILNLSNPPSYEELNYLTSALNRHLSGLSIQEIDKTVVDKLFADFGVHAHVLMPILGGIVDMVGLEDEVQIFTSGVKNILAFPEFADINKAKAIFQALEERDMLITILGKEQTERIQIIIGEESNIESLKDCSIIKANYSFDNKSAGSIGILGPTRMDYAQAVSVLEGILLNINAVIKALSGG